MPEEIKNPLSSEFKVACEIYKAELNGERVWFTKLAERLSGKLSKNTISNAIDTLFDWGIIRAEYGPTDTGRAGRLFEISNEHKHRIKDLYDHYWKDT
jgi:predicted transcriptional regulator